MATPNGYTATTGLRYADIGINLSDPVFSGKYHGKQAHDNDLDDVIERAREAGCQKLMVTGSDLIESRKAVEIAEKYPGTCYATIGVHPCSAHTFTKDSNLLSSLKDLALRSSASGHGVAFGEIGLDYDRFQLCDKETQLKWFEAQLDLTTELKLPLFLHMRAASDDFERLLKPRLESLPKSGLVHSFTGSKEEMQRLVDLGLDIGVNGCSLKTEENLEVVKAIPLERLQIETDGPWCEMRPSHASALYWKEDAAPKVAAKSVKKEKWQKGATIKGRNEPCFIGQVAYVIARVKGISIEEVADASWKNSIRMFGLGEANTSPT